MGDLTKREAEIRERLVGLADEPLQVTQMLNAPRYGLIDGQGEPQARVYHFSFAQLIANAPSDLSFLLSELDNLRKVKDRAERIYSFRNEVFSEPNAMHRKIIMLGHALKVADGLIKEEA